MEHARPRTSDPTAGGLPPGPRTQAATGNAAYRAPRALRKCGCGTSWNDRPLTLHVDHINGDFLDNRPRNLRFLCPNCHSQTSTYAGTRREPGHIDEDVVYDDTAVTPTGTPLGRRLPRRREWARDVYIYASTGP
ncbi:HNH endonuclease [Actinoplanes hulinensis]|uniref:HNH endonuclease n=1 Tax=Actinoplanes hulinensis TaxID=1144547 RepID=A0ABS7AU71_9ACTN|nr:HNH endonuclease [Actinoplanes hulinensis]